MAKDDHNPAKPKTPLAEPLSRGLSSQLCADVETALRTAWEEGIVEWTVDDFIRVMDAVLPERMKENADFAAVMVAGRIRVDAEHMAAKSSRPQGRKGK